MKILALDLGTNTGWALLGDDKVLTSGTWLLATDKELRAQRNLKQERCCERRVTKLFELVHALMPADVVIFEDVQFLSSQAQAQLWAGLRSAVMLAVCGNVAHVRAIPVGTLKKFATGSGSADKPAMAAALHEAELGAYFWSPESGNTLMKKVAEGLVPVDDNEVDALWLMKRARKEFNV